MAWRFYNYGAANNYLSMTDPGLTWTTGTDNGYTIAFWARLLHYKHKFDYNSVAMLSYGSGSGQGFMLRMDYYGLGLQMRQPGSLGYTFNEPGEINDGGWRHFVLVNAIGWGSQQLTIFINGRRYSVGGAGEAPAAVSGYPFRIGRGYDNDGAGTEHGCVDFAEVAYWGDALSNEDCQKIYRTADLRLIDNANLQLYFPLRQGDPLTCYGSKSANGTITMNGGEPIPHPVINPFLVNRKMRLQSVATSAARLIARPGIVGATSLVRAAA